MCLIDNDDAELFNEGNVDRIFNHTEDSNSGILRRTLFGIYVSDRHQKIFIIKQAGYGTIGIKAFEDYLKEKSNTRRQFDNSHSFSFKPLPSRREFSQQDVDIIKGLTLQVDNRALEDFRTRSGRRDAFISSLLNIMPSGLGSGKKIEIKVKFDTEGNQDAIDLFNQLYGSYESETAEIITQLIDKFIIDYDSRRYGNDSKYNFRRQENFYYTVEFTGQGSINHLNNIDNAFQDIRD
jgi:hypothetical protein